MLTGCAAIPRCAAVGFVVDVPRKVAALLDPGAETIPPGVNDGFGLGNEAQH
jgi:hypothetical protein